MAPPGSSVTFVVLSFEGPDLYARAGGPGARVTELTRGLAHSGLGRRLLPLLANILGELVLSLTWVDRDPRLAPHANRPALSWPLV